MPKRLSRAFFASAATVAASLATGIVAFAGPASAAPVSAAGHRATVQCLTLTTCTTLRQYDSTLAGPGLAMQAAGAYPNAPIVVYPNDTTSFLQDWTYIDLGTVSSYYIPGPVEQWGLTAFDFHTYGTDELYELEFSPAGIPTGLCAANVSNMMELRWCNGSKFQTAITANAIMAYTAPVGFAYGLSLAQVSNTAHHYAGTGSLIAGTQITFRTVGNNATQWFKAVP